MLLLFSFLIVPELIRGVYFAHRYRLVLGLTDYLFPKWPQRWVKVGGVNLSACRLKDVGFVQFLVVVLSPFVPAVLLWERGKIEYDNLKVQKALYTRIEACMDRPREKMTKKMIGTGTKYYLAKTFGKTRPLLIFKTPSRRSSRRTTRRWWRGSGC